MEHTEGKLEYILATVNSIDIVSAENESIIVASIVGEFDELGELEVKNAKHLVKCWNSHDALLAVLEKIREQAERAALVQNRSVGIIKQTCAIIAKEADEAIAAAQDGPG